MELNILFACIDKVGCQLSIGSWFGDLEEGRNFLLLAAHKYKIDLQRLFDNIQPGHTHL